MGGDAEPKEVERLALWIKSRWPHLKTAWYSGKVELPEDFDLKSLDYLKLGPYVEALGGLKSPTTNQVFYKVTSDGELVKSHI
jgi:anaerobic ribonucleoside-triphosphate reductase activating protein